MVRSMCTTVIVYKHSKLVAMHKNNDAIGSIGNTVLSGGIDCFLKSECEHVSPAWFQCHNDNSSYNKSMGN